MHEAGFSVTVPATTANLGPGFDNLGMALSLYMQIDIRSANEWSVNYAGEEYAGLPNDETNLIVQTIIEVAKRYDQTVMPHQLDVQSDIPLGKGLGSSATAIAAGVEVANELAALQLSTEEKLRIGSELEGHADNVTAALVGGITISYFHGEEISVLTLPAPAIGAVILVPPEALKTEASRGLLPKELQHAVATAGSSAGSVMVAAMAQGDWKTAGRMMEKDIFHEPYRKKLFPYFEEIREAARELGAYGMTISGAGPSIFIAVPQGSENDIAQKLQQKFSYYRGIATTPSITGVTVQN